MQRAANKRKLFFSQDDLFLGAPCLKGPWIPVRTLLQRLISGLDLGLETPRTADFGKDFDDGLELPDKLFFAG